MEVIIDEKKTKSENSDRISNLPDSLLIDILSLLPDARNSAQTCVLSKRWRNLWAFIPSLCFDMANFRGQAERFNNFVSSFLRLRDEASNMHKFALHCLVPFDTEFSDVVIETWIMYACEHKVKNLVAELLGRPCDFLPNKSRFHCDTLEDLHLCGFVVKEADNVCLPKLRTLSLIDITAHGASMQNLLSGCPTLVTLIIRYSRMYMSSISFGSVKSLTIERCTLGIYGSPPFSICAPCVEYLKFVEDKGHRVTFSDMPRVTKAIIRGPGKPGGTAYNFDLLSAISGVVALEFTCIYLKELLNRELHKCGSFNKLKNLRLGFWCKHRDCSTLSSFLKHCPNLECLCLLHDEDFCNCEEPHGEMYSEITQQYEDFHGRHLKVATFECATPYFRIWLPHLDKVVFRYTKEI